MANALKTSSKLALAVASSRVLGLVREILFAFMFGTTMLADAYQLAFRIPNLLRDLLADGALSSAFLPTFTAVLLKDGKEEAHRLGNLVMSLVLIVTGIICGLGMVFAEQVVVALADGFKGSSDVETKVALATELTQIMMPLLGTISLSAVWMGMLNAQRKFMAPAFAPVVFNAVSIVVGMSLFLGGAEGRTGVFAWSVGTLVAGVAQACAQLPALYRLGYRPWVQLSGLWTHPGVRRILKLMAPAILGLAAVQINLFVNTRFAGNLGDGALSQLIYAFRLFFLPIGLFSVALATVTTTRVAEMAAKDDLVELLKGVSEGMRGIWMLLSASTVGFALLAVPIVQVVYERGQFTSEHTLATSWVLVAYGMGLLPYGLVKILAPIFYGLNKPRIPLYASLLSVVVNIVFNLFTYRILGAPGLALGTTLGALCNYTLLRIMVARVVGPVPRRWGDSVGLVLGNLCLGGVVFGAWYWVERIDLVAALAQHWGFFSGVAGQILIALQLTVVIGLGFVVYVNVLARMRYPEAQWLAKLPGKLVRRLTGR